MQLASLADAGRQAPKLLFLTLLPFEGSIVYDGLVGSPSTNEKSVQKWNVSFTRAWTEGRGKSWAADVNEKLGELRQRAPIVSLEPSHAQLFMTRWRDGHAVQLGNNMPPALRGHTLKMPGELDFIPPESLGETTCPPDEVLAWWMDDY